MVAALAEMVRRTDTHLSTTLTPRMRDLSGAIMALAVGGDVMGNRVLEVRLQGALWFARVKPKDQRDS